MADEEEEEDKSKWYDNIFFIDLIIFIGSFLFLAIAGGVSANSGLRKALELRNEQGWQTFIPKFEYCTDNAAMIGITGYYKFLKGEFSGLSVIPETRMTI